MSQFFLINEILERIETWDFMNPECVVFFWILTNLRFTYTAISCRDGEAYHIQIYYMSYFVVATLKRITYLQGLFCCRDGEAYHIQIYCRSYFVVATVKRITYRSIAEAILMSQILFVFYLRRPSSSLVIDKHNLQTAWPAKISMSFLSFMDNLL